MLYLTFTMISNVDLTHSGVSRAKDWVSVDCGTMTTYYHKAFSSDWGCFQGELNVSYASYMSLTLFRPDTYFRACKQCSPSQDTTEGGVC